MELADFFLASAGFVEAPLADVGRELFAWRKELGYRPRLRETRGELTEQLKHLNPLLSSARPRELLVSAGPWVAYFDCFARDTDAASTCAVLAERMGVRALKIRRAASEIEFNGMGLAAGVQFHLWGPEGDKPRGSVRTIDAINDGRWVFELWGTPLDFEEPHNYTKRLVRDRFTVDMLDRYCAALGILPCGREGVLVESKVVVPRGTREVWI